MNKHKNILIVGAGLCGSFLALRMAQRGFNVRVAEKRPDLRTTEISAGRSINLAFSNRGAKAMKLAGIEDKVKEICIPMTGRMIHEKNGHVFLSPYSGLEDEYINSISRTELNALLLNEAEKMDNVHLDFNLECISVDLENAKATFINQNTGKEIEIKADIILGTDGAGSVVRKNMFLKGHFLFDYSQEYLRHGYKELYIPPGENGSYLMYKNALHIWPRGENMVIALPNPGGSFTVTLFLSYKDGEDNFAKLDSVEKVRTYFEENYPDALKLMPDLEKIFFENPTSSLGTIRCSPWHYKGKTLIMGDAAHAVVPFYGQGMNASFEDVYVFDRVMEKHPNANWEEIFEYYEQERKKDADAIGELSLDNFKEMKSDTASPLFQAKRKLETAFEEHYPREYSAKYRLVTFQENIGYAEALKRGRAQDEAILHLLVNNKLPEKMPLKEKISLVHKKTEEILNRKDEDLLAYK